MNIDSRLKYYPSTDIQAFWGSDVDQIKRNSGLIFSFAFVYGRVLDQTEIEKRVSGMIRRHPAMRSLFFKINEDVYQTIQDDADFKVQTFDICEARTPDDLYRLSLIQKEYIQKAYNETYRELIREIKKMPLYVLCFRISPKAAVYVFLMDHSVLDGISMHVLKDELISGVIDGHEDGYRAYLDFLERQQDSPKARDFWEKYAEQYSDITFCGTGESSFDFSTEKIFLNADTLQSLQLYCRKERVSAVNLILYAYAQAVLKVLGCDKALFSMLTTGRHIPVEGVWQTAGCFLQEIPVMVFRGDSPREFKKRYNEAETFSYVSKDIMWKTDSSNAFKLPLSVVFQDPESEEYYKVYTINDYENMPVNSFIINRDDGYAVYLHRDVRLIGKDDFHRIADEMRDILKSFTRYGKPRTLQQLVYEKSGKYHGTAVECGGQILSYEEFDALVRKTADVLSGRGYGPGSRIVIKMSRSAKLIAAMYGIFLSGAAAVPVGFDIPQERLRSIISSSGADLVITDDIFDELVNSPLPNAPKLCMAAENDPAVIIYTSGSTGQPKGVCHTQYQEAVTFLQFPSEVCLAGFESGDFESVISRTELSYNLAYHAECPVLLFGKKLILLTVDEQNDASAAARLISANPHSVLPVTPSLLDVFLENQDFYKAFQKLSLVIAAGEPVSDSLRNSLKAFGSQPKCLSLYGSTECQSIFWFDIQSKDQYGVPLRDTEIRIIKNGGFVPAGETGEICVCSDAASENYITGEYLPHYIIDGRRFIRTGDAGLTSDGRHFKIRGRLDRVVKIHGQRIDPSEIEQQIEKIEKIDGCAVVLKRIEKDSDALVLYYCGKKEISLKELRQKLKDVLPGYMIPALCLRLEKLPLTSNGKTDYQALTDMSVVSGHSEGSRPMTEKDRLVANAAAKVLCAGAAEFSPDTDLSMLGMDSIKVLSLISLLQKDGWSFLLNDYYADPTISGIAAALKSCAANNDTQTGYYNVTSVQQHWAERAEARDRINGLYIFRIFIADRAYTEDLFKKRVERIADNHPALRSVFSRAEDGRFIQKTADKGNVNFEYIDIRHLKTSDDLACPGKLQEGYLRTYAYKLGGRYLGPDAAEDISLHVSALTLDENSSAFIILLNHCHADGLSERIILRELLALELDGSEDGYREYMSYVSSPDNIRKAGEFWKDYLYGAAPAIIPFRPKPGMETSAAFKTIVIDALTSQRLRDKCRNEGCSVAVLINFLYGKALLDIFGEERIIFEVLFYGRNLPVREMDNTVGCLTQRLPVVIGRDDDLRSFAQSMSTAGSFGFIPVEDMFYKAWNKKIKPPIVSAIVAEIDPVEQSGCFCREYNTIDRERLQFEHYLVEDASGIRVIFHYDASLQDGAFYEETAEKLKDLLLHFSE